MSIWKLPALCALALLAACGGGGGSDGGGAGGGGEPPPRPQLVGEVVATPEQITTSELATSAGFAADGGTLATADAIQGAGKRNLLDLSFVLAPISVSAGRQTQVSLNAEERLAQYAREHAALLVPGIRVLVADEVFLNPNALPSLPGDDLLQLQLDALRRAVALVRKVIPQAAVGITVSPYAVIRRLEALDYVRQAVMLVDWVGTDPYWLDDGTPVQQLHDWTARFPALVKMVNPQVETWLLAQAFKLPAWHEDGFHSYIAQQLGYAPLYDHVLFFGWQFTAELDPRSAGMYFPPETKRLYQKYLKHPVP